MMLPNGRKAPMNVGTRANSRNPSPPVYGPDTQKQNESKAKAKLVREKMAYKRRITRLGHEEKIAIRDARSAASPVKITKVAPTAPKGARAARLAGDQFVIRNGRNPKTTAETFADDMNPEPARRPTDPYYDPIIDEPAANPQEQRAKENAANKRYDMDIPDSPEKLKMQWNRQGSPNRHSGLQPALTRDPKPVLKKLPPYKYPAKDTSVSTPKARIAGGKPPQITPGEAAWRSTFGAIEPFAGVMPNNPSTISRLAKNVGKAQGPVITNPSDLLTEYGKAGRAARLAKAQARSTSSAFLRSKSIAPFPGTAGRPNLPMSY